MLILWSCFIYTGLTKACIPRLRKDQEFNLMLTEHSFFQEKLEIDSWINQK